MSSNVSSRPHTEPISGSSTHRNQSAENSVRLKVSARQKGPPEEVINAANELLDGASPIEIDKELCHPVYLYLRQEKGRILNGKPPNYIKAQQIEELCAELMLISNQTLYGDIRMSEIDQLRQKLKDAKNELKNVLDSRKATQQKIAEQKAEQMEKLQNKQNQELAKHDQYYSGELPPKYRKNSQGVLQIRQQEAFMRKSGRYLEAQQMMQEAEALEAFENEQQKINFINDGVTIREGIVTKHAQQTKCLQEKLQLQWTKYIPESKASEDHWNQVIENLRKQILMLRKDKAEIDRTTQGYLTTSRGTTTGKGTGRSGLPKLGNKVPQSPMTRVTTVNNRRNYTRYGARRPNSMY